MQARILPRAAPLPVADGGTGAQTPAGAQVNLEIPMGTIEVVQGTGGINGYADSGVASLSLATPVTIPRGGTGATSAPAALAALGGVSALNANLTGTPRAPNPLATSNDTQIATTSWVRDHAATLTIDRITGGTF